MYKTAQSTVAAEGEDGRTAWWLLHSAAGPTTNGTLGFAELAAGADTPLHRHPGGEEAIVVLEGHGVATTSQGEHAVQAGTVIFAPRGAWHALRAGDVPMRLLVVYGGVAAAADAGWETPEREPVDGDRPASVLDLDSVEEHSAHNPELGFFHIHARFFVDEDTVGSEQVVIGQARSEAVRGAHELHRHEHASEFFCLLEGEAVQITETGDEIPIRPGDVTYVAPGEWHAMRNTGSVDTRAIFGFFGASSRLSAGYEVPA